MKSTSRRVASPTGAGLLVGILLVWPMLGRTLGFNREGGLGGEIFRDAFGAAGLKV